MDSSVKNEVTIVDCVPLAAGIGKNSLSYFTSSHISVGAIIKVPVRGKRVYALVTKKKRLEDIKSLVRKAPYALKKIEKVESLSFFPEGFIKSAEKAADYFATTTGQVLNTLIPKVVLENISKITLKSAERKIETDGECFVIQGEMEERLTHYRSLIREEFARKSSIFFCLPTIEDVKHMKESLEKGIGSYTFAIHGSLSKKETITLWNAILKEEHPVVIIGTGMFLSLPREDVGTLVIERESSRSYKTQKRPFIDIRAFAHFFAKETKKNLILGDTLLRVETIAGYKSGLYLERIPLKFRMLIGTEQKIINMKGKKPPRSDFAILSDPLSSLIKETRENHEHLFIFAARKGLSPSVVCQDCGQVVLSEQCGKPMTFYKDNKENFFFCPICREKRSAKELCKKCGSWRLLPLGIGIERVEEEIENNFPDIKLFRLDKNEASTHKKAVDIVKKFEEAPSGILLGTEMALPYLRKIENTAVASIDSLFSVPDFRINEKILYILLTMRALATKQFIIQTRNPDQPILEYALKGNLIDFYRTEIEERKTFKYPPFSIIIKISVRGKKPEANKAAEKIAESFSEYTPYLFPAIRSTREKAIFNLILKIPQEEWVDEKLLRKLRALPPYVSVEVDPETLL